MTAATWLLSTAVDNQKKILWLAHRHLLLEQAANAFATNAFSEILINWQSFKYHIISGRHDNSIYIKNDDDIILEDDPYREIRYSGKGLPPIKSFDKTENTVFANSFSKIFSPGCRLGYLVASAEIIDKLTDIKTGTDTCTNGISQVLCAEFFKRGHYPKHLENLCNIYRSRRDAMLKAIDDSFPKGTKHTVPDGGYYTWVELPGGLDAKALFHAAKTEIQITYGLGGDFYLEGNGYGNNCLRLCFSGATEEVISESIQKLGQFFCSKL